MPLLSVPPVTPMTCASALSNVPQLRTVESPIAAVAVGVACVAARVPPNRAANGALSRLFRAAVPHAAMVAVALVWRLRAMSRPRARHSAAPGGCS